MEPEATQLQIWLIVVIAAPHSRKEEAASVELLFYETPTTAAGLLVLFVFPV